MVGLARGLHRTICPTDERAGRIPALSRAFTMERVTGIEPAFSAWEADVLPLNYTRGTSCRIQPLPDSAPPRTECSLFASGN